MNTKDQLAEIEKLKAEIWNKHYSTQEAFSKAIDKLVSLVTISQLKERLEKLKKLRYCVMYINPTYRQSISKMFKEETEEITADLKYYENKLKDLEEKE
jgi:hypothetical protein